MKDSLDSCKEPGERGGTMVLKKNWGKWKLLMYVAVFTNELSDSQEHWTAGVLVRKQDAFSN